MLLCPEHLTYLLRIADGSLILGQRLAECCGHGPVVEEDIASANIALDLLGQARLLYTHAGAIEGAGRDEDAFAYWRDEQAFFNPTLVELPNGDFARSVLRTYLYVSYQQTLWPVLARSRDNELAAIAEKSAKETRYHVDHLGTWVIRLGDGTDESKRRMQCALDTLWPYTHELFATDAIDCAALNAGIGSDANRLLAGWQDAVSAVLVTATLNLPPASPFQSAGKTGVHSEHLGFL
ncbi:MAG: 1,2-phenylacetyl-CoA epoxidase subunit PaaC, partial [Gammaproteobacteria bacterium]